MTKPKPGINCLPLGTSGVLEVVTFDVVCDGVGLTTGCDVLGATVGGGGAATIGGVSGAGGGGGGAGGGGAIGLAGFTGLDTLVGFVIDFVQVLCVSTHAPKIG